MPIIGPIMASPKYRYAIYLWQIAAYHGSCFAYAMNAWSLQPCASVLDYVLVHAIQRALRFTCNQSYYNFTSLPLCAPMRITPHHYSCQVPACQVTPTCQVPASPFTIPPSTWSSQRDMSARNFLIMFVFSRSQFMGSGRAHTFGLISFWQRS